MRLFCRARWIVPDTNFVVTFDMTSEARKLRKCLILSDSCVNFSWVAKHIKLVFKRRLCLARLVRHISVVLNPHRIDIFVNWVVSMLDSGTVGPGFKSQPRCCLVTVLGKLFTPFVHLGKILVLDLQQNSWKTAENVLKLILLLIKSGFVERKYCYIVVVLRDMVKERWWSATDIKHRKHVKTWYLRDRVRV